VVTHASRLSPETSKAHRSPETHRGAVSCLLGVYLDVAAAATFNRRCRASQAITRTASSPLTAPGGLITHLPESSLSDAVTTQSPHILTRTTTSQYTGGCCPKKSNIPFFLQLVGGIKRELIHYSLARGPRIWWIPGICVVLWEGRGAPLD